MTFIKPKNIGKLDTTYSPVGLWLFDNNLNDSSGNGFNLSLASPAYATTKDGILGIYSGTRCTRGHETALTITGAMTVECIATIRGSIDFVLVSYIATGETEATNALYQIVYVANGSIQIFWERGAGSDVSIISPTGVIPNSCPHHLVITRSGDATSSVNFYVNGVNKGSGSGLLPTGGSSSTLWVMGSAAASAPAGIILSTLKILDIELTPDQVKVEYDLAFRRKSLWWPRVE